MYALCNGILNDNGLNPYKIPNVHLSRGCYDINNIDRYTKGKSHEMRKTVDNAALTTVTKIAILLE